MRNTSLKSIFIAAALLLLPQSAFAQEEDDTGDRFGSADLLIETFMADESEAIQEAEDAVATAEEDVTAATDAVGEAQAAVDADTENSQELIDALEDAETTLTDAETTLGDAQATLDVLNEETILVTELVGQLSEEQLRAFNRSLNNSLHNKFPVDLDSDILQAAIDGDYDKRQINFLTKAYEEEAKFLSLAEKFKAKADETGDDKFLEQAARMTAKAESSKEMFLARIDHDSMNRVRQDDIDQETSQARHEGWLEAREAAHEIRDATREAAQEAREATRENARDNARENASGRRGG